MLNYEKKIITKNNNCVIISSISSSKVEFSKNYTYTLSAIITNIIIKQIISFRKMYEIILFNLLSFVISKV